MQISAGKNQEIKKYIFNYYKKLINNPSFQVHRQYNVLMDSEELTWEATEIAIRNINNHKYENITEEWSDKAFNAWLKTIFHNRYIDYLRKIIRELTPKDWSSRADKEISLGWMAAGIGDTVNNLKLQEIGLRKRKNGNICSNEQITKQLSLKIRRDFMKYSPAVFITSNYQITSKGKKKPILFLDDIFSEISPGFLKIINKIILPEIKSRISKKVLIQRSFIKDNIAAPDQHPTINASAEIKNLIRESAATIAPHKLMVFIMKVIVGWGVDEIIRIFACHSLNDLYDEFSNACKDAFNWDDDYAIAPIRGKLKSTEKKQRKPLSDTEISAMKELTPDKRNYEIIDKLTKQMKNLEWDNRAVGVKLLAEYLVRNEKKVSKTTYDVRDKARNRIQNWIKYVKSTLFTELRD